MKKLHELPENTKKAIVWGVVILLGAALFFWWGKGVGQKLQNLSLPTIPPELQENVEETTKQLQLPSLELEVPPELQEQLQEELEHAHQQEQQQ